MSGRILCNKDGSPMQKTGTCPKCGKIQCHIAIYWQEKLWRFYRDVSDLVFAYPTAQDQLAAMNREIRLKTFKPESWQPGAIKARTVKHAIEQWLEKKKTAVDRRELAPGSYDTFRCHVNTHILHPKYGLGAKDIQEIGYVDLEDFTDALPTHLKIRTRREILNTLHNFMAYALKRLNLRPPPFPTIEGNDSKKKLALTIEDQAAAIQNIPEIHRDVYMFESETGVRPGESCALKIKDFNPKAKTLTVHSTFSKRKLKDWGDKEGHNKTMPLTDRACEIAQRHAEGRFPDDWLFLNPRTKKHYTTGVLSYIWNCFAGVPVTHYEGTRHSFATQITEAVDIYAAKDLLRHSSLKSTESYVHQHTEYLRGALAKRTNVVELNKAKKTEG